MMDKYLLMDETSAKYFNLTTRKITQQFVKTLLLEIKLLKPKIILDVGCGTGYITNIISNELDSTVIGCDVDNKRIAFAHSNFGQEVIICDITCLPFKNDSFDLIIASEILEHINCIDEALKEIKRIAQKDIIITVPNEPFFRIANFFRGKNLTRFGNPPDHVNHYTKKTLYQLLDRYFSNISIKTNGFLWILAKTNIK